MTLPKMEIITPHCGAMNDKFQTHNVDFYHLDAMIVIGHNRDYTSD